MKKVEKNTAEYKKKLKSQIENVTKMLETATGYAINIIIVNEKSIGYAYKIKVLFENHECHSTWIVTNTSLKAIKKEILDNIAKYKKTCCCCGKDVFVKEIHRNIKSELFKHRSGYAYICHACAVCRFTNILKQRDIYTAFWWLCSCYDRRYSVKLINTIKKLALTPQEKCQKYFKMLNLTQNKVKGELFLDSDRLDFENKEKY